MAGEIHKVEPGDTVAQTRRWRAACSGLADRLGFDRDELWFIFGCLSRDIRKLGVDAACADHHAYTLVVGSYDKQGAPGS